jgi:23S rRNA pseudouridine1911/1915/1917 synthase
MKILYEDANIVAIDKPIGILVHPDDHSKEKTVIDWAMKKYPKAEVVHRLDRETSGVLLIAKNKKAHEALKTQFQDREIKKIYHAVLNGSVRDDHGFVKKSIGRSPNDFRKWLAGRGARGELREAETFYKVLQRFGTIGKKFTYVEVRPKTGRTHQIRVHMKYLNHPAVGDELYNEGGLKPRGVKRMMLHAHSIEFTNLKGEDIKVISPLPPEFKKLFQDESLKRVVK